MIRNTDLRVGNLVLIEDDVFDDNGLFNKSIHKISFNDLGFEETNFEPLPLSQEILLKVGLEKTPHFTIGNSMFLNIGRNRRITINSVGTPNETAFILEIDNEENPTKVDDLICLHNFDYDGKLYLHKLQNIVAIFGQELNTNNII